MIFRVKYRLEEDHLHTSGLTSGLAPGIRISEYHAPLSTTGTLGPGTTDGYRGI